MVGDELSILPNRVREYRIEKTALFVRSLFFVNIYYSYDLAEELGKWVVKRGNTLFTGGSTGVMEAALRRARSENGLTVRIIPTEKKEERLRALCGRRPQWA